MKIESGKYYLTREGNKVGPMIKGPADTFFVSPLPQMLWELWGKSRVSAHHDIISEWVDASDNVKTPDGGPSSYYDMPFQDWVTLNDQMEYLAENKWGLYAIHLKDVFKGLGRWGDKEGTTPLYDTKKGIYYFCRVMKMMVGAKGLREYLQSILDDPQFKEQKSE